MTEQHQPALFDVTWVYHGKDSRWYQDPRRDRINLAYGRSKGYDDITTAQRVLAIARLKSLDLAPNVVIFGATPAAADTPGEVDEN